jgi:flagellar protein FlhE
MKAAAGLILLLAVPMAAIAGGSWAGESRGAVITYGKQAFKSARISAPSALPARAISSRVSWKITPDAPVSPYFDIKLCAGFQCIALPGLSGSAKLPASFPAAGPLHFVYSFKTRGPVSPALTILSNRVTVNYRVAGK